MKLFTIYWVKPGSGGACEDILASDMLECLQSFYDYWGDVPHNRYVYTIEEKSLYEIENISHIRNVKSGY